MENDRNRNPAAVYEDMIAILKAQVEKQEQIIQTQDETIRIVIRQIIWSRFRQFIWMCSQVQIAYWSG